MVKADRTELREKRKQEAEDRKKAFKEKMDALVERFKTTTKENAEKANIDIKKEREHIPKEDYVKKLQEMRER